MGKVHDLKTVQPFFDEVFNGRKTFEIRKNDRNFQAGDYLNLGEYDPSTGKYSGHWIAAKVLYVLTAEQFPDGIAPGYAVLGIEALSVGPKEHEHDN